MIGRGSRSAMNGFITRIDNTGHRVADQYHEGGLWEPGGEL